MNLLKKGDKIRMTRNFGALSVGDILTIQAVDKKDESMPYLAGGYWLSANCFEPVSEFHAGQIYMLIDKDSGDIVGIAKFLGCANDHKSMQWRTIRTDAGQTFVRHTSYQLLTGKEIGKAIRKWDADHAKKPEPEYNEVKRHAKAGEYIKIVKAFAPNGYKDGDTLLVTGEFNGTSVLCKSAHTYICDNEYVVLEPRVKKVKRHAKVGEYIKVLFTESTDAGRFEVGDVLHVTAQANSSCWRGRAVCFNGTDYVIKDSQYVVLEGYKPEQKGKHSYTAEQIAEAKRIVLETLKDIYQNCKGSIVFGTDKTNHNIIRAYFFSKDETKMRSEEGERVALEARNVGYASAKCSDHDEPNEWIGKCVALCKALHKPIPVFITGD